MSKTKLVCPHCESDDVGVEATANWNVESQEYEICDVYDQAFCRNCESEFHANFEEIEDE